ncbi:hypothetical protein ZHAS_00017640 [Anopheles sinensis]|uniref:Uncharacterized protein n=1 Tax=Anopheles sinensis TaxID=74873 RepID=A0A084WHD0_ANOSI|nr:hypothetical protein ZHAS_00017640 [Anopheles sinensis]
MGQPPGVWLWPTEDGTTPGGLRRNHDVIGRTLAMANPARISSTGSPFVKSQPTNTGTGRAEWTEVVKSHNPNDCVPTCCCYLSDSTFNYAPPCGGSGVLPSSSRSEMLRKLFRRPEGVVRQIVKKSDKNTMQNQHRNGRETLEAK